MKKNIWTSEPIRRTPGLPQCSPLPLVNVQHLFNQEWPPSDIWSMAYPDVQIF